eukprot:Clim_evm12s196 gene=Clim_evmTU12s196
MAPKGNRKGGKKAKAQAAAAAAAAGRGESAPSTPVKETPQKKEETPVKASLDLYDDTADSRWCIGIDIGSSSCRVAVIDADSSGLQGGWTNAKTVLNTAASVVANADGHRATSAAVSVVNDEDGTQHFDVGASAKSRLIRFPGSVAMGIIDMIAAAEAEQREQRLTTLRKLGLASYSVMEPAKADTEADESPIGPLVALPDLATESEDERDGTIPARKLLTSLFDNLRVTAESYTHSSVRSCVVSIPAGFDHESHPVVLNLVRSACKEAGMACLRIINSPMASIMAMGVGEREKHDRKGEKSEEHSEPAAGYVVAVVDIGGTAHSSSIYMARHGLYTKVSEQRSDSASGGTIDQALMKHFAEEFKRKTRMDLMESKRSQKKLVAACEEVKKTISSGTENAAVSVDSLHEGVDFQGKMHKGRFEMLLDGAIAAVKDTVTKSLAEANVSADAVDEVIVCGGCGNIAKLRNAIAGMFPKGQLEDSINQYTSLDDLAALGSALQAYFLRGHSARKVWAREAQREVEGLPISIKMKGDGCDVTVFRENTNVPCHATLECKAGNGKGVTVALVAEDAAQSKQTDLLTASLGEVKGDVTVGVDVTADGILKLSLFDKEASRDLTESIVLFSRAA